MSTDPRQVRDSLQRQSFMRLLGAHAPVVEPGHVMIELPFRADLCQQNGYLHAGVVTSVADSACGYAALTLMPPGSDVLSVEFKVNLLAPAKGDLLVAEGRVLRVGRTITVCQADGLMRTKDGETRVATMLATMMTVTERPEVTG